MASYITGTELFVNGGFKQAYLSQFEDNDLVKGGCNVDKKVRDRTIQRDIFQAIRGRRGRTKSRSRTAGFGRVRESVPFYSRFF